MGYDFLGLNTKTSNGDYKSEVASFFFYWPCQTVSICRFDLLDTQQHNCTYKLNVMTPRGTAQRVQMTKSSQYGSTSQSSPFQVLYKIKNDQKAFRLLWCNGCVLSGCVCAWLLCLMAEKKSTQCSNLRLLKACHWSTTTLQFHTKAEATKSSFFLRQKLDALFSIHTGFILRLKPL